MSDPQSTENLPQEVESAKVEYETLNCKYTFSEEEKRDIAEKLANKTHELDGVEAEKKSVMSSFKDRIEGVQLEIKTAARLYQDGYEYRNIECEVDRDFDAGEVKYIRTDTGEVARTKKITMAERQRRIEEMLPKGDEPVAALSSTGTPGKTDEEIRRDMDIQREMRNETSAL